MKTATIIRYLRTLRKRDEDNGGFLLSTAEERAIDAAVPLLRAQPLVNRAVCFIDQVSAHLKDGECFACGQDGHEANPACVEHDQEPFELSYDEAFDTLHRFISGARTLSTKFENLKKARNEPRAPDRRFQNRATTRQNPRPNARAKFEPPGPESCRGEGPNSATSPLPEILPSSLPASKILS